MEGFFEWFSHIEDNQHHSVCIGLKMVDFKIDELKLCYEKGIGINEMIEMKRSCCYLLEKFSSSYDDAIIEFRNLIAFEKKYKISLPHPSLEYIISEVNKKKVIEKTQQIGYVYFIKDTNGKIKIGKAKKPQERFDKYITENAEPVELLHIIYYTDMDYSKAESMRHNHFEHKNHNRERFNLDDEDIKYITSKGENFIIN